MNMTKKNIDGKFGTLEGVFIPNVLQMIGVILFMRVGWVLGHAGLFEMTIIVTLSALILLITGLSLSAIVSNMRMSGGGAYYIISRALGIEFGSAIGILSCISMLCSIALCVSGFSLSLYEFFPISSLFSMKAGTLAILFLISYFSTNFALKTQTFIFVMLATSIGAIFVGSGASLENLIADTSPASLGFWGCFAMFFPAMTGIESGMSMSGDLRNPSRSIPIGTLGAIGVVYAIYMGITLFLSATVSPEMLRTYPFILYYTSKIGFFIIMGIWAATLSSALGGVLGGPRVIQAIAKDGILPKPLSKGFGPTNLPRVATVLVFVLAMALTLGTDIDQIIPILTMSCLISYCLINFIAFFESFMRNPSWRPSIRIHWLISLTGAIGCLIAMFMINPGAAFTMIALVLTFCVWTGKRKLTGNWDDLKHSIISFFVHKGTIRLGNLEASAKSWRPHILTLFNTPSIHKNLAFFSHALNQGKGFLTFGTNIESSEKTSEIYNNLKEDLKGYKIPSHLHLNVCSIPNIGNDQIVRNYGFGLLKPNTILLSPSNDTKSFIKLLLETHFQHKNIIILKDEPTKDYLFSDPTRKEKQINLWWRGKYPGNFEFSLALAYLLQQSKLWPKSKINIKVTAKDETIRTKLFTQFEQYQPELRMSNLEFTPIIDSDENFFNHFDSSSQGADLTFLGLKKPEESTTVDEYEEYYSNLIEKTKSINNIAYVLRGEKIEFRKIFRG